MRQRLLGRTGLKVSEIAIGGIGPMGKYGPVAADGTSPRDPGRPTGSYRGNPHFEVAEIEENAAAAAQGPLSDDELDRLAEVTADLPEITWRSQAAA